MKKILLAILVMIFVTPAAIAATECECGYSQNGTIVMCASLECAQQEQKKSGKVHITGTIHPAEPSLRTTTFMFPVRIPYEHDGKEEYLNHASPYFGLNLDENATEQSCLRRVQLIINKTTPITFQPKHR